MGGLLDEKICLVTGGGTGIGAATAVKMAEEGAAAVVIAARREQLGEQVASDCREHGTRALFLKTDVTNESDVSALMARILNEFGRLDVAFNNAGYQEPRKLLAEQTPDVYDLVFDANTRSVFLCMREQLTLMEKQGFGNVIVNTSVSGVRNSNPGLSLYSASKAATISLVKSAALEYGPLGIRVNGIAPGRVATDMVINSGVGSLEAIGAGLPLRRTGKPEEVANAVVWLASDQASYITGSIITADGGFLAS